jgi:hypothetical protein
MKRILLPSLALLFFAIYCLMPAPGEGSTSAKKSARTVTFSKDVAPILYKNCVDCHRPNELAPMSFISYKETRPWARSIKEKVLSRQMPPWHADPRHGEFANDRRLSQSEIDTIVAWVDTGAREGSPRELPPAPKFVDGWKIGKPDIVFTMPEEYTVSAAGADEYINFILPTNFKEDMWIQAAEINPGNKRVVHHVVAFIQTPQMIARGGIKPPDPNSIFYKDETLVRVKMNAPAHDDTCGSPTGGIARGSGLESLGFPLCFYAPGKDVDLWPEGTAKSVPAGSNIIIQMHYSKTTGKAEKDRTSVGLKFASKPPEKMMTAFGVLNHYFKIPAGADNHEVKSCYTFSRDVEIYSFLPHMHLRGKDMKYEAVYPDGRRQTLLWVPNYNFSWQTMYRLAKPVVLPKGTKMVVTAHFDNSERNKYNPDPTKAVRFGEPTYDEMMIGYFDYVPKVPLRTAAKLDPKSFDAYTGSYAIGPGAVVTIRRAGERLLFTIMGQPELEAFPESETMFFFKLLDALVTFVKNDRGETTELVLEINGRTVRAKKINKVASGGQNE